MRCTTHIDWVITAYNMLGTASHLQIQINKILDILKHDENSIFENLGHEKKYL